MNWSLYQRPFSVTHAGYRRIGALPEDELGRGIGEAHDDVAAIRHPARAVPGGVVAKVGMESAERPRPARPSRQAGRRCGRALGNT